MRPRKRPTLYTIADAAKSLGIPVSTAYDRIRDNGIGFFTTGGTVLLDERDLAALREAHGVRGRPKKVVSPTP
jgi:excisionase family DNA binding protein